jgi:hypothetical protein
MKEFGIPSESVTKVKITVEKANNKLKITRKDVTQF